METQKKLKQLGIKILDEIKEGKNPSLELPVRTLSNIYFDENFKLIKLGDKVAKRAYFNIAHSRKFMQTMLIAAEAKKIIDQNVTISIRDLYYALKHTIPETKENTFEEQNESDPLIEDIEATLNILREQLHLTADRKGYIAGNIIINDSGDLIDCSKMGSSGWAIPSNVEPEIIKFKDVNAKFVLVVEKDAVWQRLNQDKFWDKQKCIILTGKGQPEEAHAGL